LITSVKANNWETQYTEASADGLADAVKYSEINRQTVIIGVVGTDGRSDYIVGSGAALTAFASATTTDPILLSFSGGNSSLGGLNYIAKLTTDSTWAGLSPNNTNYLFFDRSTAGVISQSQTVITPQYGYSTIDGSNYSLLHWDGTAGSTVTTDTYGAYTWSDFGTAMLSTVQSQFGGTSLTLPGSSLSYVQTTGITNVGSSNWTLEGWFYLNSTTADRSVISSVNIFGFNLLYNAVTGNLIPILAGSTIANSINSSAGSSGAITVTSSAWHSWALTYNSSTYKLFLDGAADITITSTVSVNSVLGGIRHGLSGAGTTPFSGYIDEFRMTKQVCRYSTAFTVPSSAFSNEVHFYNLRQNKMYSGGSTGTEVTRLFVGEAKTDGTSVTEIASYPLKGVSVITSTGLAINQALTFTHGFGLKPRVDAYLVNLSSEAGYLPGDELPILPNYFDGTNSRTFTIAADVTTVRSLTGAAAFVVNNKTTAAQTTITMLSWAFRFYLSRPFR
jgi:hypothetical protein